MSLRVARLMACAAQSLACDGYYDPDALRARGGHDPPVMDAAIADAAPPLDARTGGADATTVDARIDGSEPGSLDSAAPDAGEQTDAQQDAGCEDQDAGGECPVPDACPNDPAKTEPGVCGCGIPDVDGAAAASCIGLRDALVHRYRFEGAGTAVTDAVGSAHGTLIGATLANDGTLTLAGGTSDQYVDLPNGLISSLQDVTIEAWVTWAGGNPWQRIFDFGDSTSGSEGTQADGRTHLFVTPLASGASGTNLLALFRTPAGEVVAEASAPLPTNAIKHIAVVIDDAGDLMTLYLDGELAASAALTTTLSEINDINNWIGRSQWMVDDELGGVVHELRIFDAALSGPQLATSFAAGPDPGFLAP